MKFRDDINRSSLDFRSADAALATANFELFN